MIQCKYMEGDMIMKYCKVCNQNVMPVKQFSVGWFILNLLTVVGGGIYIINFLFLKKKVCPNCHCNKLEGKHDIIINCENGTPILSEFEQMCKAAYDGDLRAMAKLEESRNIYGLFYRIYGRGYNTPEQFDEFKQRYNAKERKKLAN